MDSISFAAWGSFENKTLINYKWQIDFLISMKYQREEITFLRNKEYFVYQKKKKL